MSRPRVVALIVGAALATGCGVQVDTRFVRTAPLPVSTDASGYLTSGPVALTLADVARIPPASPKRVVMRILFDIEWGYLPDASVSLHPAVVRTVGGRILRAGFALVRPNIVAGYPVLGSQSSFGKGVLVRVNILTPNHRPAELFFVLQRLRGHWFDVYDSVSLLGAALAMESSVQSLSAPLSKRASSAAAKIETQYQALALRLLGRVRLPQPAQS